MCPAQVLSAHAVSSVLSLIYVLTQLLQK
jgi:hypothetical protein